LFRFHGLSLREGHGAGTEDEKPQNGALCPYIRCSLPEDTLFLLILSAVFVKIRNARETAFFSKFYTGNAAQERTPMARSGV
jgi:hypothetical protein